MRVCVCFNFFFLNYNEWFKKTIIKLNIKKTLIYTLSGQKGEKYAGFCRNFP